MANLWDTFTGTLREAVGVLPGTYKPQTTSAPSSDVSYIYPQSTGGYTSSTGESQYVTPSGTPVASAQTPTYSTTGTGTNYSQPAPMDTGGLPVSQLLEPTPQEPDFDPFREEINAAIKDLQDLEGRFESELPGQLSSIEQSAQANIKGIESETKSRIGELDTQAYEARQTGQAAEADERRAANELLTGLQSRFGSGTGTGMFTSELVGRQVLQNLGKIRSQIQGTIFKIEDSKQRLRDKELALRAGIMSESENLKLQARNNLNDRLATIRNSTSMLRAAKGQAAWAAVQDYQSALRQVEARNTAFLQDLAAAASQNEILLTNYQNAARDQWQVQLQKANRLQMTPYGATNAQVDLPTGYYQSPTAAPPGTSSLSRDLDDLYNNYTQQ